MKTRRRAVAADDKVVPTAVAKRDWFLKASDLATLGRVGGGAAWGVGRFPIYYSVKDLDRLALRVHGGAAGLAKKKAGRARRLDNKAQRAKKKRPVVAPKLAKRESEEEIDASSGKRSAKKKHVASASSPRSLGDRKPKKVPTRAKQREQPVGTKEKRVVVDDVEEEVEFSGRRRSRSARKWAISDVMESVQDDDDGDFNPAKRLSAGKSKSGKRLRAGAKSEVDDVQDEDDHVELRSTVQQKKKPKAKTVAVSKSTGKPIEGKSLAEQMAHNLKAVGKWDVLDCGDCYDLELWPNGNGLGGEAFVCDCEVDLSCTNLSGQEMDFKAVFKTEKGQYVGVMTIRLNPSDTLSINYFNGARGVSAVEFTATAQRTRIKKKK
jgi:hypothetical protein